MKTVRDVLASKPKEVWSISPSAKVIEALKLMSDKQIGALMVMDEPGSVCGIISERDYSRKIALRGKHSDVTAVEEIMTPSRAMPSVEPSTTVEKCMVLMTAEHLRHLPVFEDGRFVGIISIGDVVKSIIDEKEYLIEQLSNYISGK